jgi:hypothetical protein
MEMNVTFKSYSDKSKARRALVQVHKLTAEAAETFLCKENGKAGFYVHADGSPSPNTMQEPIARMNDALPSDPIAHGTPRQEDVNFASSLIAALHSDPEEDEDDKGEIAILPGFGAFAMTQLQAASNTRSAPMQPDAPRSTRSTSTRGQKIEKERPTQNGVQQPSAGTLCRAVWDQLTTLMQYNLSSTGAATVPSAQDIKKIGEEKGWNNNNVSIEYYRWRKFNGVTGRGGKGA